MMTYLFAIDILYKYKGILNIDIKELIFSIKILN